ncbi:hypothetical protein DOTSEDRAFT_21577 [Lecanosticta acicola]|uniref:C2H2-type domain-containing protein n=1 Tax=Lecanosticta acicola TaxID=111012 RepID=A0AAI8YRS5_9PEZI|nr:hypothetical protein DOTSEDRAFT_21577 [Lecanosticta acicola]
MKRPYDEDEGDFTQPEPKKYKSERSKNMPCPYRDRGCQRMYTCQHDVDQHVREAHTGERPHRCYICEENGALSVPSFARPGTFYRHLRLTHKVADPVERKERKPVVRKLVGPDGFAQPTGTTQGHVRPVGVQQYPYGFPQQDQGQRQAMGHQQQIPPAVPQQYQPNDMRNEPQGWNEPCFVRGCEVVLQSQDEADAHYHAAHPEIVQDIAAELREQTQQQRTPLSTSQPYPANETQKPSIAWPQPSESDCSAQLQPHQSAMEHLQIAHPDVRGQHEPDGQQQQFDNPLPATTNIQRPGEDQQESGFRQDQIAMLQKYHETALQRESNQWIPFQAPGPMTAPNQEPYVQMAEPTLEDHDVLQAQTHLVSIAVDSMEAQLRDFLQDFENNSDQQDTSLQPEHIDSPTVNNGGSSDMASGDTAGGVNQNDEPVCAPNSSQGNLTPPSHVAGFERNNEPIYNPILVRGDLTPPSQVAGFDFGDGTADQQNLFTMMPDDGFNMNGSYGDMGEFLASDFWSGTSGGDDVDENLFF